MVHTLLMTNTNSGLVVEKSGKSEWTVVRVEGDFRKWVGTYKTKKAALGMVEVYKSWMAAGFVG